MTGPSPSSPSIPASTQQDARLAELLDEIIRDLQHDRVLDLEVYAGRYPDLADQLADLLPSIRTLVDLGGSVAAEASRQSASAMLRTAAFDLHGTLGDFRLLREIGRGGMGIVYEAEQISLSRRVAVKVLPLAALLDERQVERFRNEARAAAMLKHENIVSVYSVGCERGIHHYAMELVEGQTLAAFVRRELPSTGYSPTATGSDTKPIAQLSTLGSRSSESIHRTAARLGIQAAQALDYAHRAGVIHRDIKPSNLMLNSTGKLSVTDFGLARVATSDELSLTGDLVGTLRYMSPEQVRGHVVDERTDIHSLGVTLYELVTGRVARDGGNREELSRQITDQPLAPLRTRHREAPRDLETILGKATAMDPNDRYATAGQLAEDLQRFLDGHPVHARPVSRSRAVWKWCRRNPVLASLSTILLLVLVSLLIAGPMLAMHEAATARDVRQHWYVADINLAYSAWYAGNADRAEQLLERQEALSRESGQINNGFALAYLRKQIRESESRIIWKQDASVLAVAVAPDGFTVAYTGADHSIVLGDLRSGGELHKLRRQQGAACSLAFCPDGKTLASVGLGPGVTRWDVATGQELRTDDLDLKVGETLTSLVYTPSGDSIIASTDRGRLLRILRDGYILWSVQAHDRRISQISVSSDGQLLVSAGDDSDRMVKLWSVQTGKLIRDIADLGSGVTACAFSPDGQTVIASAKECVYFWDTQTGSTKRGLQFSTRPVSSFAVTSDGLLVTGGFIGRIWVWDLNTGIRLSEQSAHRSYVTSMAATPDGQQLVTGSADGTVRRFDLREAQAAQSRFPIDTWFRPTWLSLSADGSTLATVSDMFPGYRPTGREGELTIWNARSGTLNWRTAIDDRDGMEPALSPDGKQLATCGKSSIKLWDVASQRVKTTLSNDPLEHYGDTAFSPDGRWLAVVGTRSTEATVPKCRLMIWDLNGARHGCETFDLGPPSESFLVCVAFDETSHHLIVSHSDRDHGIVHELHLTDDTWHDVASNTPPVTFGDSVTGLSFVSHSTNWTAATWDGRVVLRQLGLSDEMWKTRSHDINAVAISADGQMLATGHNFAINLWEIRTGDQLAVIETPVWVSSLAFAPDGQALIWCGGDGSVHFERVQ